MAEIDVYINSAPIDVNVDSAPIDIEVGAAQGPAGPTGPAGPNSVTSATTSDGTANLSLASLSVAGSASVDNITFDQTPEIAGGVGVMRWNNTDGTVDLGLKGGNVTLQLGQEFLARVVNKTGSNLLESQYKVVRIRIASEGGAQGQRLAVVLAQGDNDPDSTTTLGVVTENIDNNQEGFITIMGQVRNINTTGSLQGETWVDGDVLYLSPTIAGGLTKVKPQAPQHSVTVAYVEYAHQNNGKLFVKVDNGYELNELHDVAINGVPTGQFLKRNSENTLWVNSSIVSADITDATSAPAPNLIAKRNANGGASFSGGLSGYAVQADSTTNTAVLAQSLTGTGLLGSSADGIGVVAQSDTNTAGTFTSSSGTNHAAFGNTGDNRSFVARLKGAFGWFRGVWTGRLQAADTLTANHTWTLPDTTGTVALTNDPRFTDARTPLPHTHVSSQITDATVDGVANPGKVLRSSTGLFDGPVKLPDLLISKFGHDVLHDALFTSITTGGTTYTWTHPLATGTLMLGSQNLNEITNPALARDALGSGTVGDQLFTAETQANAQTALGLLPMSISRFTTGSGTITIPPEAKFVSFIIIGGGGGGGSGAVSPAGQAASGGTGGRGGIYIGTLPFLVSDLDGSAITYSVGAGGVGGPATVANGTGGSVGGSGGGTTVTINGSGITAAGGIGGLAGVVNASTSTVASALNANGTIGTGTSAPSIGATASASGGASAGNASPGTYYPTSGGPGGSISTTSVVNSGGPGTTMGTVGLNHTLLGGASGISGSEVGKVGLTSLFTRAGTGGGGGMATAVTFAGNSGGAGGLFGGAGGGGSGARNGQPSGAGGNGAGGLVQVTFYY